MKKMIEVVVVMVVVLLGSSFVSFANTTEDVALLTFAKVESLLRSDVDCPTKHKTSRYMSKSAMQELFHYFEKESSSDLARVKRVNDLMNIVFADEGEHFWSDEDMRVLYMVRASWEQSIAPECFDAKTNGFSSEEWLRGAVYAIEEVCRR